MLPKRGKIIDFCYNARRTYAKFGSGVSNIEKKIFLTKIQRKSFAVFRENPKIEKN